MKDRFRSANSPATAPAADHLGAANQQTAHAVVGAGLFVAFVGRHLENACVGVSDRR
jgi:putative effector of murein hydrolase